MKSTTTKESAAENLITAGFNAEIVNNGLNVSGDGWSVHYSDMGQDFNAYEGNVPERVEELAVWDNEAAREMKTQFIARDCNGSALQFTGSGRSIQCTDGQADVFESEKEAQSALDRAEENGGSVEVKH